MKNNNLCACWRRLTLLTLLGASLAGSTIAEPLTVGISAWSGYPENIKGFKAALEHAGFIEHDSIVYLYRNAQGDRDEQSAIAREFERKQVDMVYSLTTPGTIIIKQQLPASTPIVFSIVTYPADSGLIESFEYSGNNLVGTSNFVPLKNYIRLLNDIVPAAQRVAIFHRLGEPNSKIQAVNLARLLKRQGIEVIDVAARSIEEVGSRAQQLAGQVQAFITTTDTLMQKGGEARLIEVARQAKIPILSSNKQGIGAGATFGPVADFHTLGTLSGQMAAQILSGQATTTSLASQLQPQPLILVNRASLKNCGLTIPKNLTGVAYVD